MHALVTGGSGFIGARVVSALLARGCRVSALVRSSSPGRARLASSGAELAEGSLTEAPAHVATLRPDVVVHVAWNAEPGRYLTAPDNLELVGATLALARAAAENGCRRFVGTGTCFEYRASQAPLREDAALGPETLYAVSKAATASILEAYTASPAASAMSFAWARVFYPYGPEEAVVRLVPAVACALLRGERAQTSAGEQVRDYLHVDDVGEAIAAVALSSITGAVNIGSGVAVTVRELVTTIAELCGAEDRLDLGALPYRPGDPMYVCAQVDKLRGTGFRPRFDLRQGLQHTIESWRTVLRLEDMTR